MVAFKQAARAPKRQDRLRAALPHAQAFLEEIVQRGLSLPDATRQLVRLLDDYGAEATDAALAETLRRGTPTPASVALWLEQRRRAQRLLPKLPLELPPRPDVRGLHVTPHDLETYDALSRLDDDTDPGAR